jgi:hypothetical protein
MDRRGFLKMLGGAAAAGVAAPLLPVGAPAKPDLVVSGWTWIEDNEPFMTDWSQLRDWADNDLRVALRRRTVELTR